MHLLSARASENLHDFVRGQTWGHALADSEVEIVHDSLPGRTVVAAARSCGKLWIVVDDDKPDALAHLVALVEDWPIDCPTVVRGPAPRSAMQQPSTVG